LTGRRRKVKWKNPKEGLVRVRRNRNKDAQDGKDRGDVPRSLREHRGLSRNTEIKRKKI
jgi:hypothetical protein